MTQSTAAKGQPVPGARRAWARVAVLGAWLLGGPAVAFASEGGEGGGLIALNGSLLIQIINFLLLLALLYRFLYKPLLGVLAERTRTIKEQLAEAQAAREAAQRQMAEFEARLRAAQAEAQAMRERVQREAAETRERLTAEARREAGQLIEAAQAQIAQEVRRAKTELRAEVGSLAVQIAERLMRRSLRAEDQQRLVQEALAGIDST